MSEVVSEGRRRTEQDSAAVAAVPANVVTTDADVTTTVAATDAVAAAAVPANVVTTDADVTTTVAATDATKLG